MEGSLEVLAYCIKSIITQNKRLKVQEGCLKDTVAMKRLTLIIKRIVHRITSKAIDQILQLKHRLILANLMILARANERY